MALSWHCDICGRRTHVNPPTEPMYEEVVKKDADGKATKVKQPIQSIMRVQDMNTGKVNEIQVVKQQDLEPRTVIVRLQVGQETIQRDLCMKCLKSHNNGVFMRALEGVMKDLAALDSK